MTWSERSFPLRCTRSTAVMIMPGVQKPHCRPWCSRKASCIGCSGAPSAARPSMVRTSWPSAMTASVVQDFTALPSRWTTQAPHCEVSQPTWVPVSRRFSRRNWTRRVRGSILAFTGLPFTIREILAISTLLSCTYWLRRRLKSSQGHNMGHPGNEQPQQSPAWDMARYDFARLSWQDPKAGPEGLGVSRSALHRLGEIGEKFVGQFLGRAVNQALAELGQLAADLRLDIVAQKGAAILLGQPDRSAAFGEAGDTALAFA